MSVRDDFSPATKTALAMRAAYQCSICECATVGPSDEAADASASVGVAAHIAAAAPRGRRYRTEMTKAERSHIDNGIWLCGTHATLIDRDEVTYPIERLQQIRRDHEDRRKAAIGKPSSNVTPEAALFAIGPDLVCLGVTETVADGEWSFAINHYVAGDFGLLAQFIADFDAAPTSHRFVLSNGLGDGRTLSAAPVFRREGANAIIACRIEDRFPRKRAQELGADLALSSTHDIFAAGGNLAMVRGLEALPQKVLMSLSLQKGDSVFNPQAGSRFGEFYRLFDGSPWLGEILKLEAIRLAAIPLEDLLGGPYTPFHCVERIHGVEVLGLPVDRRLPVRLDFEVKGVGRWRHDMSIFVPHPIIAP